MPAGRPTDYSDKIANAICEWIAEGKSLRSFCAQDNTPSLSAVCLWIVKHHEFRFKYESAKQQEAQRTGKAFARSPCRKKNTAAEMVYLIGLKGTDLYKVGMARDVSKRCKEIQTANPFKVEFLAEIQGGRQVEAQIHKMISAFHVRGEWFEMDEPTLVCFIALAFTGGVQYA